MLYQAQEFSRDKQAQYQRILTGKSSENPRRLRVANAVSDMVKLWSFFYNTTYPDSFPFKTVYAHD
jgi:hypothetical protein